MAIRSAHSTSSETGPERERAAPHDRAIEAGDVGAGARRRGDLHAQLPLAPRGLDDLQALDAALRLPGLGGLLLGRLRAVPAADLVVVRRLPARVAHALLHPVALRARALLERSARVGVLLVRLARVPALDLALGEVGLVAAAVDVDLALREIELDDPCDGAGEELAVVADEHGARAHARDEPLEALEPVEVEVVRRLVEQEDVVAAQQQRGEARARGLAARRASSSARRARPRGRARPTAASARSSRSAPPRASQRSSASPYAVSAPAAPARERARGLLHREPAPAPTPVRRPRNSRTLSPARRSGSCGQVADVGGARAELDRPLLGTLQAREDREQRRLARAVRAHETDDVARGDDQVETGEEGALPVPGGERSGDQGCAHSGNGSRPGSVGLGRRGWRPGRRRDRTRGSSAPRGARTRSRARSRRAAGPRASLSTSRATARMRAPIGIALPEKRARRARAVVALVDARDDLGRRREPAGAQQALGQRRRDRSRGRGRRTAATGAARRPGSAASRSRRARPRAGSPGRSRPRGASPWRCARPARRPRPSAPARRGSSRRRAA